MFSWNGYLFQQLTSAGLSVLWRSQWFRFPAPQEASPAAPSGFQAGGHCAQGLGLGEGVCPTASPQLHYFQAH